MFVLPSISVNEFAACWQPWLVPAWCAVCLLMLWVLRWRHEMLAAKYAKWQAEAQAVEMATHNALYRPSGINEDMAHYPAISIVVPVCNELEAATYLLPRLLDADYHGYFEVIVADELASGEVADLVKRLQTKYENLRYTRIPSSSRQIELRKLAITLGIKAAHGEWAIVVNPQTVPESNEWLQHFAENLSPVTDFAEAYHNYYDDGTLRARRAILERVRDFNLRLGAYEQGLVIGCSTANFAVRKRWFVEQGGFADSLTMPFGEEAVFAFHHAVAERSLLLCSPDTKLVEYVPESDELTARRIVKAETFRHICHTRRSLTATGQTHTARPFASSLLGRLLWQHAWWYGVRGSLCSWLIYLFLVPVVVYAAWRVEADVARQAYDTLHAPVDVAVAVLLALGVTLPIVTLRRTLRALHERKYGLYIIVYDLLQPWRGLILRLRCRLRRGSFVRRNM